MSWRTHHLEDLAKRFRQELVAERQRQAVAGEPAPDFAMQLRGLLDRGAPILSPADRELTEEKIRRATIGLGPLDELLDDPLVDEVMINGDGSVYVERRGRLEEAAVSFEGEQELRDTIERILAPVGRRVDELQPMADARLPDGSRVNVVIPPLAVDGPTVTIRRFGRRRPSLEQMVANGSLGESAATLLAEAVAGRRTVLISGGTGAGKTTVLNALSAHIPETERVVTIEDAAELKLHQRHVVRLESRSATVEGRGEVSIRDLLKNALRMRPDRIILGEVRGAEALDLLTALNTGHEGALSTVHANSPTDALRRLENLCLMAGLGLPHAAIREQLGRGLDLIVQVERRSDGSRGVAAVAEVICGESETTTRTLIGRDG